MLIEDDVPNLFWALFVSLQGIETEEPVLQLGNLIFHGKYKDTMGTAVIFEEDKEQQKGTNLSNNPTPYHKNG